MDGIFQMLLAEYGAAISIPQANAEQRSALLVFHEAVGRVDRIHKYLPVKFFTPEIKARLDVVRAMIRATSPHLTAATIRMYAAEADALAATSNAIAVEKAVFVGDDADYTARTTIIQEVAVYRKFGNRAIEIFNRIPGCRRAPELEALVLKAKESSLSLTFIWETPLDEVRTAVKKHAQACRVAVAAAASASLSAHGKPCCCPKTNNADSNETTSASENEVL
jgi:hypothetical protein